MASRKSKLRSGRIFAALQTIGSCSSFPRKLAGSCSGFVLRLKLVVQLNQSFHRVPDVFSVFPIFSWVSRRGFGSDVERKSLATHDDLGRNRLQLPRVGADSGHSRRCVIRRVCLGIRCTATMVHWKQCVPCNLAPDNWQSAADVASCSSNRRLQLRTQRNSLLELRNSLESSSHPVRAAHSRICSILPWGVSRFVSSRISSRTSSEDVWASSATKNPWQLLLVRPPGSPQFSRSSLLFLTRGKTEVAGTYWRNSTGDNRLLKQVASDVAALQQLQQAPHQQRFTVRPRRHHQQAFMPAHNRNRAPPAPHVPSCWNRQRIRLIRRDFAALKKFCTWLAYLLRK